MQPLRTQSTQLPDASDFVAAASLTLTPLVDSSDFDASSTESLFDPTQMFPSSLDMLGLSFDSPSLFNFDTEFLADDPSATLFSSTSLAGLEEAEKALQEIGAYLASPDFFLHIVESAIDEPAPTEVSTVGPAPNASAPSATTSPPSVPRSVHAFSPIPSLCYPSSSANSSRHQSSSPTTSMNAVDAFRSPLPSLCYPESLPSEGSMHPTSPAPSMGSLNVQYVSPVPSLCYPESLRSEEPVQAASPAASTCNSPFTCSPVPSLCYPESDAEEPVQPDGLDSHHSVPAADSPVPSPVVEQSVLGRVFRSVGATVAPSRFPKRNKNRHSPYPSPSPRVRHDSPSRNRASSLSGETFQDFVLPGTPRNVQSSLDPANTSFTYTDGAFRCPVPGCKYMPPSARRKSDIRRHLETHRSNENQQRWVCCGVPVDSAEQYGIKKVGQTYWWRGWRMVGGCRRGFSRRDSLGRHLKTCGCVGTIDMAANLTEVNDNALIVMDQQDLGY
ncbi:uncharacterized protein C8Q71DRAFT_176722 [Rhodofomes roseus]|uniref:C2H2-type domain-containing protein n=1 Tax=Rhodofomes roseus TaxID=34475 RepID=A0ABQ8KAG5_9APHY|nr:uncharacterized protein C8Q71DRAFT_176722 [Rhodofomes roseus]KAH9833811.1 hypothetical protein C8Q71DRAFT_176722 [Rhodofomes roseus]